MKDKDYFIMDQANIPYGAITCSLSTRVDILEMAYSTKNWEKITSSFPLLTERFNRLVKLYEKVGDLSKYDSIHGGDIMREIAVRAIPDLGAAIWGFEIALNEKECSEELEILSKTISRLNSLAACFRELPMYKNCQRDSQKNAEYLESRIVNIPSSARI